MFQYPQLVNGRTEQLIQTLHFSRLWPRLVKIDLNTVMSFNEEMSEVEINNVVMKVQSIIQEDGLKMVFNSL